MKDALKEERASPEEATVKYLKAENDGLKKTPDGCRRKKVLRCYFRKEAYS